MVELQSASRCFFRRTTSMMSCLALLVGGLASEPALARSHHGHAHRARVAKAQRAFAHVRSARVRFGGYTPPFSDYVVDGNSGRVLFGRDENALRHPASLTKVMTLYLLFEQFEKGRLSLDSTMEVSAHAAAQPPTKLGLRPGSTIRIEDAIYAIVTKSSNDMAVAIAEKIGGDEATFAQMMTRKAHALGMSRTNYVNASGLPDDMQLTTARDMVTLGRAIHDHFPRYFHFFSTPSFRYHGQFMANHNHLMEQVEGMDGIKTGYTRMSGFNLLSSVNRNGHWLIASVLGGKTRLGRDRIMADLIASQIDKCATSRTAPMIAENPDLEHVAEAIPVIQHEGDNAPPVEGVDDEATVEHKLAAAIERDVAEAEEPSDVAAAPEAPAPPTVRPVNQVKVNQVKVMPVRAVPEKGQVEPTSRARPAFVSNVPRPPERDMTATGSIRPSEAHSAQARFDGSSTHYVGTATSTPSTLKRLPRRDRAEAREKAKPVKIASLAPEVPQAPVRGGWMVQVGAAPAMAEVSALLARAKQGSGGALNGATPYTEKVRKGNDTLFRARFAGLDADGASTACKNLKRAGISCFASKN